MPVDVTQFRETFFEESFEGLELIESGLLGLTPGEADLDLINTIFRAAHSIKGGSGSFGLSEITEFTHQMETLLDQMRAEERPVTSDAIDLLLRARDHLASMLGSLRAGESIDPADSAAIQEELEQMLGVASTDAPAAARVVDATPVGWRIDFAPHPSMLQSGNDVVRIVRELRDLGKVYPALHSADVPMLADLDATECHLAWSVVVLTAAPRDRIGEVFDWVTDEADIEISPITGCDSESLELDRIALEQDLISGEQHDRILSEVAERAGRLSFEWWAVAEEGFSFDELKELSDEQGRRIEAGAAAAPADGVETPGDAAEVGAAVAAAAAAKTSADTGRAVQKRAGGDGAGASSLRVSTEKIDALVNMVGELVITQSMLKQVGTDFDMGKLEALRTGLVQLERNSRELQEAVMRIRMLPISSVFQRFPRLVRDTSQALGKTVELIISGEQTELDKTVLEKLGDPLVHIVRNSLDHGLEPPDERVRCGKPRAGRIRLHAAHEGGKIQIEITDDGRGLSKQKILAKARQQGLVAPEETPSTEDTFDLVFHPGFSTAEQVTDVSGRGVGMDVVRRNIKALGGTVQLSSEEGVGTKLTIRLPLTVAILDGQLLRVGSETYILPLVSIIESITIESKNVLVIAGRAEVYRLRSEQLPIIRLYEIFGLKSEITDLREGLLVVVEAEGRKAGIFVDELLEQQQVVIKSLESNYRPVQGLSGATILGDGRVAMILDVGGLMSLALDAASGSVRSRRREQAEPRRVSDEMEDATA